MLFTRLWGFLVYSKIYSEIAYENIAQVHTIFLELILGEQSKMYLCDNYYCSVAFRVTRQNAK